MAKSKKKKILTSPNASEDAKKLDTHALLRGM